MARPVSEDDKRQALARVLDSRALGRSEQLRNLLSYVCKAEIEGRGHELNEYVLGVSVLGRPQRRRRNVRRPLLGLVAFSGQTQAAPPFS